MCFHTSVYRIVRSLFPDDIGLSWFLFTASLLILIYFNSAISQEYNLDYS